MAKNEDDFLGRLDEMLDQCRELKEMIPDEWTEEEKVQARQMLEMAESQLQRPNSYMSLLPGSEPGTFSILGIMKDPSIPAEIHARVGVADNLGAEASLAADCAITTRDKLNAPEAAEFRAKLSPEMVADLDAGIRVLRVIERTAEDIRNSIDWDAVRIKDTGTATSPEGT